MRIAVDAHPSARVERVELTGNTLSVWVRARPVDRKANAAIEEAIALALGLPRRAVRLIAGATGRRKLVEIDVTELAEIRARLKQA